MAISFLGLCYVTHPRRTAVRDIPLSNHVIEPFTIRCGAKRRNPPTVHMGEDQ
jgi:hypothetical protein